MKIKLPEITISENEIIQYLEQKGFKIETHEVNKPVGSLIHKIFQITAIPIDEEYDVNKHKSIIDTFQIMLGDIVKNFLLKQ